MALRAFFVDGAHIGGQEMAVNIGLEDEAAIHFCRGLKYVIRGHGAQLREGCGAHGFGEFHTELLGFGERLQAHVVRRPAGKECAAFADGFLKEVFRERRGH